MYHPLTDSLRGLRYHLEIAESLQHSVVKGFNDDPAVILQRIRTAMLALDGCDNAVAQLQAQASSLRALLFPSPDDDA